MKRQKYLIVFIALVAIVLYGCKKDDDSSGTFSVYNGKTTARFNTTLTYGTMTDYDGNVYRTIIIGTQTWMAENLRATHYKDGTSIPKENKASTWMNLTSGAYCAYDTTTNEASIATYGLLYNWYAVETGKLAPSGWHVPSDAEWTTLTSYLGGASVAGGKMKEAGTTHWSSPNTSATNESGFTALPSGHRDYSDGTFYNLFRHGFWWGSTATHTPSSYGLVLHFSETYCSYDATYRGHGFTVRLLKD